MKIIIIAAVARNRVIGRSTGEMPWHSKEEFQHFKSTTFGFPVIMGRKTFDSLGQPLKGRMNIVLSRQKDYKPDSPYVITFDSLEEAYDYCENSAYEKAFVIGGGNIFPLGMEKADEMIISVMNLIAEGDVYFPEIDENTWAVESREKRNGFEIIHYVRRK